MKNVSKIRTAIGCMFLLGIFTLISCKQAAEKQGEKMMENVLEQSTGEKTDVDMDEGKVTIESDSMKLVIETGAKTWPDAAPNEVPKFTWGNIIHTTVSEADGTKSWGVHLEGVPMDALDKYDAELKKAGFKTMKFTAGKGGSVTSEKGNLIVTLTVGDGNGHVGIQERQ